MEKILKIIQENSRKTGNSSGIGLVNICKASGMEIGEVITHMNVLGDQKQIYYREGINHSLYFAQNH